MKRSIPPESSGSRQLKRQNLLVLCSIGGNGDTVCLGGDALQDDAVSTGTPSVHCISTSSSSLPCIETDLSYLATEEENDADNVIVKAPTEELLKEGSLIPRCLAEGLISTSTSCSDLSVEDLTDLSTAVIFEAGLKHFDRKNRCQIEKPIRITSILDFLKNSQENFTERCRFFNTTLDDNDTEEQAFLNDDDYLRVHLPGYVKRLDRLSKCKCCDRLDDEAQQFQSIYFSPDSVNEAKVAATSLCNLVSHVVKGDVHNGFAVIRPPGHHAEPSIAGGFCVINNVAVAAAYAREKLGIKRVLIVDWDVHHGNGTQSIFLKDPNVLYFSVHRWEGGRFYPHSNGGPNVVGSGEGAGFNVNIGWSRKGMGDAEYYAVWERLLMPISREFQPELVLVSAGFDAAKGDIGECNVSPECFGKLTSSLMTLADGKVVCALEGGYVRSILGTCVESVVRTLLDRKSPELSIQYTEERKSERGGCGVLDCINKVAAKNIRDTITAHQPFWSCLQSERVDS